MVHTLLVTSVALAAWRLFPTTAIVEFSASVGAELDELGTCEDQEAELAWQSKPAPAERRTRRAVRDPVGNVVAGAP